MDHSDVPEPARGLIEAAELEAQSTFDTCTQDRDSLLEQAYEAGVDPSGIGFSPGRPALEAAHNLASQCSLRATNYLFKATAVVYWKYVLRPDVAAFLARLEAIWAWAHQRFGLNFQMPEEVKRNWRIWALQDRAASPHSMTEQRESDVAKEETPSASKPAPRRGYRTEIRRWMESEELETVKEAADRLNVGYDVLKSIMSNKGEKRYSDATLDRVLEKIRT